MNMLSLMLMVLIPVQVLLLVGIPAWLIVRAVNGRHTGRRSPHQETEEARLMQELHHGMAGFEERVESLETIAIERERHKSDAPAE